MAVYGCACFPARESGVLFTRWAPSSGHIPVFKLKVL